MKNIYLCVELALENYDAKTKFKQNFLGDLRSPGEAVTCLPEVPRHIAFLYMKPGCLELWVASRDKSECINYCKKHKVTQTKKRAFEHLAFLENEHSSKTVLLLRAPRNCVREHSSNGLTLRAFRKLEGPFATTYNNYHKQGANAEILLVPLRHLTIFVSPL